MPTQAASLPHIAVILNARAGGGHGAELAERVTDLFRTYSIAVQITLAEDGARLADCARAAVAAGADVIVAGGGDGSVNAVASAISGSKAAFGVLPLGTLNHFAKDLNIPLVLEDAIRNIAEGQRLAIDTGEVNGVLFINNSSLGLYPDIVRDRQRQQSRLGRSKWPAFMRAVMAALHRYPFLDVRIRVGDTEHRRRTPFLFIGNNEYLTDGLRIGQRDSLTDGKLSLYVCHRTSRLGLLRLALQALFGHVRQARDFDVFDASDIEINTHHHRAKRLRVATDGEVAVMQTPLRYRLHPASLHVIVPIATAEEM